MSAALIWKAQMIKPKIRDRAQSWQASNGTVSASCSRVTLSGSMTKLIRSSSAISPWEVAWFRARRFDSMVRVAYISQPNILQTVPTCSSHPRMPTSQSMTQQTRC